MEKKTIMSNSMLAAAAINFSTAYANAPSKDARYEELKRIMRDYIQGVVQDECVNVEGFDFNTYLWDDYEIEGLEIVLLDTIKHTASYCKPPELTGMHAKIRAHPTTGTGTGTRSRTRQ